MRLSIFIASLFILFVSCRKEKDYAITYGYHYFPFDEGRYVVYDVIDVFHDSALFPAHDTSRYQIKEVIGEWYIDNEGDTARKLKRYFRESDTLTWSIQDVWNIKRTPRNAEVVEENKRKIKMAFAISYDQNWDGNAHNSDDQEYCYYRNIYKPISVGGFDHDSSVVVEHVDFTSYIQYWRAYTVYAPNIGRVYSIEKYLDIDNYDTLNIHYGTEVEYTAIDWGIE